MGEAQGKPAVHGFRPMSMQMRRALSSRSSRSPQPTSMTGVPARMPCRMIPERCSPTVPIAVRISVTRSVPEAARRASSPPACGDATKPRCRLASRPGTSRSIACAPGSRRPSGRRSDPADDVGCDGGASPKPPSRFTSPPLPTISNAPGRSSQPPPAASRTCPRCGRRVVSEIALKQAGRCACRVISRRQLRLRE